jgi:hypothetical protein
LEHLILPPDQGGASEDEKKCFFINLYNALMVHSKLEIGADAVAAGSGVYNPTTSTKIVDGIVGTYGLLDFARNLGRVSYQLGGERDSDGRDPETEGNGGRGGSENSQVLLSLNEIEHGILRANRASVTNPNPPFDVMTKSTSDPAASVSLPSDPVLSKLVLQKCDPRIHFALNCGALSCPPIRCYEEAKIERQLDIATKSYLQSGEAFQIELNVDDDVLGSAGKSAEAEDVGKTAGKSAETVGGKSAETVAGNVNDVGIPGVGDGKREGKRDRDGKAPKRKSSPLKKGESMVKSVKFSKLFEWYREDFLDDGEELERKRKENEKTGRNAGGQGEGQGGGGETAQTEAGDPESNSRSRRQFSNSEVDEYMTYLKSIAGENNKFSHYYYFMLIRWILRYVDANSPEGRKLNLVLQGLMELKRERRRGGNGVSSGDSTGGEGSRIVVDEDAAGRILGSDVKFEWLDYDFTGNKLH